MDPEMNDPQRLTSEADPAKIKTTEKVPLCVDLDGTLIRTDTLVEALLTLLKQRPLSAFLLPFPLLKGKANDNDPGHFSFGGCH